MKTSTRSRIFVEPFGLLIVAALLVTSLGCGGGQNIPDSKPMPEDRSFTGVWYSPQFEHIYLEQDGQDVRGIYTYEDGGKLRGTVDGNLLRFEWTEPGDKSHAQRTMSGRGYFQLQRDGDQTNLQGEWGYNEERTGGGVWNAEWVRELKPEDPLTLEDLEAQK